MDGVNRIFEIIDRERGRQCDKIELIASENFVSSDVLKAVGSVLTNKYAEGYPGRRYYGGCEFVDQVETIAIENVKKLFGCNFANVQPHSGAQANLAALFACLEPGDTLVGMALPSGGHLTHGAKPTISGRWFKSVPYHVDSESFLINYDEVRSIVEEVRPKLLIAGASAYPRVIDFKKFREIADFVGALLMVDVAHYAGLIVAGEYPNPFPYADIVTSTTHKTLRGPRGGIILTNDEQLAKKIDKAVFPGVQGGPLMHVIAGKAVAFEEALSEDFKRYIRQVKKNAVALAESLIESGISVLTGGTDSHMVVINLCNLSTNGAEIEEALDEVGITCNKNSIPSDPLPPSLTSGIRLGTAAATTRGMMDDDFRILGKLIAEVILAVSDDVFSDEKKISAKVKVGEIVSKLVPVPYLG